MKMLLPIFVFAILFATSALAQDFELKGKVQEQGSQQPLPGAEVIILTPDSKFVTARVTAIDGSFSIKLKHGNYILTARFLGYVTFSEPLLVNRNMEVTIKLSSSIYSLSEVVISTLRTPESVQEMQMGMEKMDIRQVERMPSLLGEPDILRSIQLMGGVQAGGEGVSGIFVRGGSHDQNLFLWDGAPLYNVNHMFGLLSVFNPDVVSSLELYKAGFPARYGGRLSSVVDVKSRDGNPDSSITSLGIGLISSRLTHERPFANGRGSVIASGRRTYFDIFTSAINRMNREKENYNPIPSYYFYDLNLRASYLVNDSFNLLFSTYHGNDYLSFVDRIDYNNQWGNTSLSLGSENVFASGLRWGNTIYHSRYQYYIQNETDDYLLDLQSNITDWGYKSHFSLPLGSHKLNWGLQYVYHHFSPQTINTVAGSVGVDYSTGSELYSHEAGIYLADEWEIGNRLGLNYGIRLSGYFYDEHVYLRPEPRMLARYSVTSNTAIKAAFSRMNQYMHLVSNGMASMPTDIWYPATREIAPQMSDQVSTGIHAFIPRLGIEIVNEVYYKWMYNVVEYAEGADVLFQPDFESQMVSGTGWSYGNELSLKKTTDMWSAWASYTISWAKRQFDEKNFGNEFFTNYDRRHYITFSGDYQLSPRTSLGASWIFASGNAATLPVGRFGTEGITPFTGTWAIIYEEKNNYRYAPFHHLDVSLKRSISSFGKEGHIIFSVYNIYNRRNTFFIHMKPIKDNEGNHLKYIGEHVSLLPIIPTVSYNLKF